MHFFFFCWPLSTIYLLSSWWLQSLILYPFVSFRICPKKNPNSLYKLESSYTVHHGHRRRNHRSSLIKHQYSCFLYILITHAERNNNVSRLRSCLMEPLDHVRHSIRIWLKLKQHTVWCSCEKLPYCDAELDFFVFQGTTLHLISGNNNVKAYSPKVSLLALYLPYSWKNTHTQSRWTTLNMTGIMVSHQPRNSRSALLLISLSSTGSCTSITHKKN